MIRSKTSAATGTWALTQPQAQVLTTEIIPAAYPRVPYVSRGCRRCGVAEAWGRQRHIVADRGLQLGQIEVFLGRMGHQKRSRPEEKRRPPGRQQRNIRGE